MTRHSTKRRSKEEYDTAMRMYSEGVRIVDIVKTTGIKRGCVSNWVKGRQGVSFNNDIRYGLGSRIQKDYNPLEYLKKLSPGVSDILRNSLYSYVLGLYFGDGYICKFPRTKKLAISLDNKYNKLNDDVYESLKFLFGKEPTRVYTRSGDRISKVDIGIHSCNIGIIFPHEGVGAKHLRKIELQEWQKEIIDYRFLLKGLIMSDGSFYVRQSSGREVYNFTNCSIDIFNLAKECLEFYDIRFNYRTYQPNNEKWHHVNKIEISHRESVEKLKKLIGTKTEIVSCFEV